MRLAESPGLRVGSLLAAATPEGVNANRTSQNAIGQQIKLNRRPGPRLTSQHFNLRKAIGRKIAREDAIIVNIRLVVGRMGTRGWILSLPAKTIMNRL